MSRRDGSFGMVALLLATGAVLVLVASLWRQIGAPAIEVSGPGADSVPEEGSPAPVRDRDMPDLEAMRRTTDGHAGDVQTALASSE